MSDEKGNEGKTLAPRQEARKLPPREVPGPVWRTTAARRGLEWALRLTLAAALAAGRIPGGGSPFGVALVAASGAGAGGFATLLGAVGGYLLSWGLDQALRYAACGILVFSASFAFYDLPIYQRSWFMPLSAALLNALTGLVSLQQQARLHPAVFFPALILETILTALSAYAFRVALARPRGRRESPPTPDHTAVQSAQRRLRQAAAAFQQVFSSLKSVFPARAADGDEDPAVIYDRAANRVCGRCALRDQCWQSLYQDTHDLLNAALPGLLKARRASAAGFPQRFRDRCVDLPGFVTAVNEELQAYLLRRQYDRQVGQSRRAVCRQYAQLAEVLEDAAAAIAPSLTLLPPKTRRQTLTAVVGVAGRKKAGETVSGDACSWFKEDSGRLCLLLCDGMGSGREARKESELAIDLLEKFLKAGFSPENALKTLDQAFCLRLDEAMGFSTVDLLTLDLCSGEATLYKLGSAPSYLKQGGTVRVLRGRGFPPGLSTEGGGVAPAPLALRLGPGDCLVLLTDGVLDDPEGEDGWLREDLMRFEGDSPAALAEAVADHSDAAGDDKTVLALRVGLRDLSAPRRSDRTEV